MDHRINIVLLENGTDVGWILQIALNEFDLASFRNGPQRIDGFLMSQFETVEDDYVLTFLNEPDGTMTADIPSSAGYKNHVLRSDVWIDMYCHDRLHVIT